jgi:hypothetical protein
MPQVDPPALTPPRAEDVPRNEQGPMHVPRVRSSQPPARRYARLGPHPLGLANFTELRWPGQTLADLRRGLGVPPRTIYGLALHHVIADLEPGPAVALLRSARRALLPGGTLRLTVPWSHPLALHDGHTLRRMAEAAGLTMVGGLGEYREPTLIAAAPTGMAVELARPTIVTPFDPTVSVLIDVTDPTAATAAAKTVLAQTFQRLEVLLGDPGDQHTHAVMRSLDDPRVRIVPTAQLLQHATGDYVVQMHAAERLQPDAIERLAACLRAMPSTTMVAAFRPFIDPDGTTRITPRLAFDDVIIDGETAASLLLHTGVDMITMASTCMFRRQQATLDDTPVTALHELARTLHLLARGDLAWLAEPISSCMPIDGPSRQDAKADATHLRAWATSCGMWQPDAPTNLCARRMGARPWWSSSTRRAWAKTTTARDRAEQAVAWQEVAHQRTGELLPQIEQALALAESGEWTQAARVATQATRQRPDHVPAAVAASHALAHVGLVDDARFLLRAASAEGPVILGEGGQDPNRGGARFTRRWSLWTTVGDVDGRLHLQVRSSGGAATLPIKVDGHHVGDLGFDGDNSLRDITLDLEGSPSGMLVEFGPCAEKDVQFSVSSARVELI